MAEDVTEIINGKRKTLDLKDNEQHETFLEQYAKVLNYFSKCISNRQKETPESTNTKAREE